MSEERERQAPGIRSTRVGFASAMGVSAAELEPEPGPAADAIASASQDTIPAGTGRHTIVSARFGGVAPTQAPPERTRLRLIAGKVIPGTRYRLIRWLGEGGMGVVYEAEHIDIERHVALKILRYDLSQQPEMTQVFRDEARAASRMGHANIVEVFDFGELPDGRLFFCMELLDGKDLVPDEGKVRPPAEVLAILRQLCKGLAAAHQQGIVHRDIKPENIILVKRGGRDGVVKLVDFGISAMLAADSKNSSERITGTPHYMAPEQIQGQAFDGRLDMYAVGCVAYELLTGCAPFPGEVVEEVLLAQIDNPPRPPCSTDKGAATPPALEAVILRCLEKRPADRYADMNDLEAALCEAQIAAGLRTDWDDLPLPDVDPDRVARLRRQMPSPHAEPARRRWLLPVSIAASLAAGVALTFALIGGEPTPQARSEVDRIAEEALQAASLTNYVAPPPDDPSAPTAYQKVLALEALEGSAEAIADERAKDLRLRFSTGLLALGDKYWDVARPFAIEYYIWARTFDPDNQRAVQRSGLSIGNFVAFQERAARGAWQEGELRALLLVGAMAEGDDVRRQTRVEQALASNTYSPRDEVALDEQLRGAGIKVPPPRRRPEPPPPPQPPPPAPDPVDELMPVPLPDDSVLPGDGRPGKKPTLTRNRRDPKRARALAEEGSAALRAGRRGDAENLFHQAIAYDNRNVKALMGLSDVYFDTGAKQKSLQFAELAVEAAPQSRASNLKLGDAYYNVLRYRDALRHYKKAQELGETSAQGRIDKVTARIGD
jgi:serine/threonine protein kinase